MECSARNSRHFSVLNNKWKCSDLKSITFINEFAEVCSKSYSNMHAAPSTSCQSPPPLGLWKINVDTAHNGDITA